MVSHHASVSSTCNLVAFFFWKRLNRALRFVSEHQGPVSLDAYALATRVLRKESPCSSIRWALCTIRSKIASASVGSPM